jgi:hypothetical protein
MDFLLADHLAKSQTNPKVHTQATMKRVNLNLLYFKGNAVLIDGYDV